VALEHQGHQRAAGDELDEVGEEGLLAMLVVVLLRGRALEAHELHGDDPQALALEAGDDLAGEPTLEGVGLHQYECAVQGGLRSG